MLARSRRDPYSRITRKSVSPDEPGEYGIMGRCICVFAGPWRLFRAVGVGASAALSRCRPDVGRPASDAAVISHQSPTSSVISPSADDSRPAPRQECHHWPVAVPEPLSPTRFRSIKRLNLSAGFYMSCSVIQWSCIPRSPTVMERTYRTKPRVISVSCSRPPASDNAGTLDDTFREIASVT